MASGKDDDLVSRLPSKDLPQFFGSAHLKLSKACICVAGLANRSPLMMAREIQYLNFYSCPEPTRWLAENKKTVIQIYWGLDNNIDMIGFFAVSSSRENLHLHKLRVQCILLGGTRPTLLISRLDFKIITSTHGLGIISF